MLGELLDGYSGYVEAFFSVHYPPSRREDLNMLEGLHGQLDETGEEAFKLVWS